MSAEEKIEIHRGLKGVYFERSGTTFIDGKPVRVIPAG